MLACTSRLQLLTTQRSGSERLLAAEWTARGVEHADLAADGYARRADHSDHAGRVPLNPACVGFEPSSSGLVRCAPNQDVPTACVLACTARLPRLTSRRTSSERVVAAEWTARRVDHTDPTADGNVRGVDHTEHAGVLPLDPVRINVQPSASASTRRRRASSHVRSIKIAGAFAWWPARREPRARQLCGPSAIAVLVVDRKTRRVDARSSIVDGLECRSHGSCWRHPRGTAHVDVNS